MEAEASGRHRFLFISNGHGEDTIAAAIISRMPKHLAIEAYPMVGSGDALAGICAVVGPRASVSSGGSRTAKGSLRRDVAAGALSTIPPALQFLRKIATHYDRVVVIGDVTGIIAAYVSGLRDIYYIDCYKTGHARLYSWAERWFIRRACAKVMCRTENLAQMLRASGTDAASVGNVMLDTIPSGDYDARSRRRRPRAVTLLPGSRGPTIDNFVIQVEALRLLPDEIMPDVFLAVAGGIDTAELAQAGKLQRGAMLSSESADLGTLTDGRLTIHMARGGAMGNLLGASDVVLSQAGTATTQALGSGRPSVTFVSSADRRSRFDAEQRYFGEARVETMATPEAVSQALKRLLVDDEQRQRLGALGRDRIGEPGAIHTIIDTLVG